MPTFEHELRISAQGFPTVAGVDEVGRGPLAGPVVAAAVLLEPALGVPRWLAEVDDSKVLTSRARERIYPLILDGAAGVGVGSASSDEIDSVGIAPACRLAMVRAVKDLPQEPAHLLVDYVLLEELGIPCFSLAKGDSLCYSIAAASIVAKVTRDRLMTEAELEYPGYRFSRHKGYATLAHRRCLFELGPSPIHRRSFSLKTRLPGM